MTTTVYPAPATILQFFDNSGRPAAGGSILTQVGGVNYPTYQDSAGSTPLPNPIPLNSRGEISTAAGASAQLFLVAGQVYTFTLYDVNGNQITTANYVTPEAASNALKIALANTSDTSLGAFMLGKGFPAVDSIAALRTCLKTAAANRVFVTGYYASGDGGGGPYYYDSTDTTSADNGGTIIVAADGGRWKLAHQQSITILQFGAKGDGTTDDTAAINAALAASQNVEVPAGVTPLISSTVAVGVATKLKFLGGFGNSSGAYPASYFIKKSTMTTVGITVAARGWVDGGGVVGQTGNTGDGIQIIGNSAKISHFMASNAGGVGVRVGNTAGSNCNTFTVDHVVSQYNGSHGFYAHDGSGALSPNVNAGAFRDCFSQHNGGNGFHIGNAWWVKLNLCLSEVNTGWGLYLDGTNSGGYPSCRYALITGGDYNEGNTAGIIYDAGYFSTFVHPDPAQLPTTASVGLPGSAVRTWIGGSSTNTFPSVNTTTYTNVFGTGNDSTPVATFQVIGTGSVGEGGSIQLGTSNNSGTSYRIAGKIKSYALSPSGTGIDALDFSVNNAGTLTRIFTASTYYNGVAPAADNTVNLGTASLRWGIVYAATGAINTSDEREKQQIQAIDAAALRAVRRIQFKKFKFNDAVARKGDQARWHFGVIAQEVKAAFEAEGLDPFAYGVLCYDEWEGLPGVVDKDGNVLEPARPAGNRYGVRHDELFALKLAAMEAPAT